jgi:hypothetical protein
MKTEIPHSAKTRQGCSMVVFYETPGSREAAVRFCDRLVERFWKDREFDIHWASFSAPEEQSNAVAAAKKAASADLIVFAVSPHGSMPEEMIAWIESWLPARGEHEGALVGLLGNHADSGWNPSSTEKNAYLRNLAHRLSMDYWTEIPQQLNRIIPDSLDSYSARADRVTHVLDDILHQHVLPPGMGT